MGIGDKTSYFQVIKSLPLAAKPAFLSFLMVLLIPNQPLKEENSQWIESFHNGQRKENYELLKVYSVLKSKMDLKDAKLWTIAKTILVESLERSIDPMLVLAIISIESRFRHEAVSTDGARGLMQIKPRIADSLAKEADIFAWNGEKSLDDPILNVKVGIFYLFSLKKSFKDLKLVLTAYNWGPTQVRNRLADEESIPLDYAAKVLSAYRSLRQSDHRTH